MASLKFRFSWRVTIVCGVLAALMVRASFWQWDRHLQKKAYIESIENRLQLPVVDIHELFPVINRAPDEVAYRRVTITGRYDFEHEMVLRNRRHDEMPGVFVITPLKIDGTDSYLLVSRGFLPLTYSSPEKRRQFRHTPSVSIVALLKEGASRKIFAPADPPAGDGNPWVDAWLRVDVENMSKQLPYRALPIYAEVMSDVHGEDAAQKIVSSKSGRDEIFNLSGRVDISRPQPIENISDYPIPVFDTVVPPGRHFGYVFEWAIMALITLGIAIVLQLRRPLPAS
ncbi:MAG: SURF1 family protein [Deltaproteobacteria bacterium]|nr:SURF1 family protein [Deltaproteobacteria bacterium]